MSFTVGDDELVSRALNGGLVSLLAAAGRSDEDPTRDAFQKQLVRLHNTGRIDLLAMAADGAFGNLPEHEAHWAIEIAANVLADLDGDVETMVRAVAQLGRDGTGYGSGGAANPAFRTWLARDVRRASHMQRLAEGGDAEAASYIVFALEVQGDLSEAGRLARTGDGDLQRGALTALSRMVHPDRAARTATCQVLASILAGDPSGETRAGVLHVLVGLLAQDPAPPRDVWSLQLLDQVLQAPRPPILFDAAHLLWRRGTELPAEAAAALMTVLLDVPADDANLLGQADLALSRLLAAGGEVEVLAWLEQRMSKADGAALTAFPSCLRAILQNEDITSRVLVRWMLGGDVRLCDGLNQALFSRERNGGRVRLREADLDLAPNDLMRLAERVCGFFLLQPNLACGMLIDILRAAPKPAVPALQDLLGEVLLLNYDSLREPLSALAARNRVKRRVDPVLTAHAAYFSAAEAVPELQEFRPSESRRRIRRLKKIEEMREMNKAVDAKSIASLIATKVTILYGRTARTRIHDQEGAKFVDLPMTTHSVSFPLPLMEVIDPIGLEYQRWILRFGRRA